MIFPILRFAHFGLQPPGTFSASARTPPAFGSQGIFEKVADLAAAFPNQTEDRDLRFGVARHHTDQSAFAHAAAAENADALPPAAGEKSIHGADAAADRLPNRYALERQRSRGIQRTVIPS